MTKLNLRIINPFKYFGTVDMKITARKTPFVYTYVVVKVSHPLMLVTYYLILYYQERLF